MQKKMMVVLAGIMLLAFAGVPLAEENNLAVEAVYHFEEGEGSVIKDSGPNGYHGFVRKGTEEHEGLWVEGREGKAIYLDGEEGMSIEFPAAVLGESPQEGMLEFWVKPAKDQRGTIFSKYTTGWGGFYMQLRTGGRIAFWRQGDRVSSIATTRGGNAPAGEWTHVRVTWDLEEGSRVYINGRLRAISEPIVWTGGRLITTVGCMQAINQEPGGFFTGAIDELKIFVKPAEEE